MGDHVLFFYGTLMAPQILHRVVHGHPDPEPWQKAMLRFQPAVLNGYRRHRVRGADYPGIVPATEPSPPGCSSVASVLGTLVSGLTDGDIHRLDMFEGSEYTRETVHVHTLPEPSHPTDETGSSTDGQLKDALDAAGSQGQIEGDKVAAVTYVWAAGVERLEEAAWDFETFKREKMAWWVEADEREW
ncbi:disease resistance protein Aig2 [Penicillium macrosclerotiorum]|uniref:disease resistance protein Aig2 n=1 Tax=Penicillium macrosclerotiorum TaxID=303699 RepID=UPI0025493BC8|nr:disease resistance protein Aig2 [Penicillium macrosclerotiorum]KAJ5689269.1 disease resistance protein Aig2 [Penicillium macrosclerotiorum]